MGREVYPVFILILVCSIEIEPRGSGRNSYVDALGPNELLRKFVDPALLLLVHFGVGCCVVGLVIQHNAVRVPVDFVD